MAKELDLSEFGGTPQLDLSEFQNAPSPKTKLGDLARNIKAGIQEIPGVVTGIADLAPALAFNKTPFSDAANYAGEATGFQPGKWAKQTEFTPEQTQSLQENEATWKPVKEAVNKAWADKSLSSAGDAISQLATSAPDIAAFYATHPLHTLNQVARSLPSSLAGGAVSQPLKQLGRVLAPVAEGAAAGAVRTVLPGTLERAFGSKAVGDAGSNLGVQLAGGIGEGAVQAGQAMDQSEGPDKRQNALGALASGAIDTGIAFGAGHVANKMGFETLNTAMAKAGDGSMGSGLALGKRLAGGALTEGMMQEFPQSTQEAIWQNWVDGKPLMNGVLQQGVEGALSGAIMGAGANVMGGALRDKATQPPPVVPDAPAAPLLQIGNTPDPLLGFPDGTVARRSEIDAYINGLPADKQPATPSAETGIPVTPSAAMGLNPAAGPMSAAASIAVDTGAHQAHLDQQANEADQAAYDQYTAEQDQKAAQQDTVNQSVTKLAEKNAEAQMSDSAKRATVMKNGDIGDGDGAPFKRWSEALRRAKMEGSGWSIAKVADGFVARRKDAQNGPSPNVSTTGTGSAGAGENVARASLGDGSGIANQPSVPKAVPDNAVLDSANLLPGGTDAGAVAKSTTATPAAPNASAASVQDSSSPQIGRTPSQGDSLAKPDQSPVLAASQKTTESGQSRDIASRNLDQSSSSNNTPLAANVQAPKFTLDPLGWSPSKLSSTYNMDQLNQLYKEVQAQFSNAKVDGAPVDAKGMATTEHLNADGQKMHAALKKAIGVVYEKNKAVKPNSTPAASTQSAPLGVSPSSEPTGPNAALQPSGNESALTNPSSGPIQPWQMTQAEYIEQARVERSKEADKAIAEAEALPDDYKNGMWNKANTVAQIKQRFADRSAENLLDVKSYEREYDRSVKTAVAEGKPVSQPQGTPNAQAEKTISEKSGSEKEKKSLDGVRTGVKLFRHAALAMTIKKKGFDSLDADTKSVVQRSMLGLSHDPEILKSIIESIPVNVVNDLARHQLTPEMLFHNPSMLQELGVGGSGNNSVSAIANAATSIVRIVARAATENPTIFDFGKSGGIPIEALTAINAGENGSSTSSALPGVQGKDGNGFLPSSVLLNTSGAAKDVGDSKNFGRVSSDGSSALSTINGKHVVTPSSNDVPGAGSASTQPAPPTVSKNSIGVKPAASAGVAVSPEVAKPKKNSVRAKIEQARQARADYFTPGNVVKGYGGFDEVLAYTPPKSDGSGWSVKVQEVKKVDGQWVRIGRPQDARNHSTQPDARELAKGPIDRLGHTPAGQVQYTNPRADGKPHTNAVDRGVAPEVAKPATKPRAAETADGLFAYLKSKAGGVVGTTGRGIMPVYAWNPAGGKTFHVKADGSLEVLSNQGVGVRDATTAESNEFHDDLTADRIQVAEMSRPGYGSGYKNQQILNVLHSPSGNGFAVKEEVIKPAPTPPEQAPAPEAIGTGAIDGDLRGYAYALVKNGQIITSGSFPSKQNMPAEDSANVSHFKKEADARGADLYIGGYPGQDAWTSPEGLIFGMTFSEIQARQQGHASHSSIKGAMPSNAVVAYEGQSEPTKPAQPAAKAAGKIEDDGVAFSRTDKGTPTLIIQHNLTEENLLHADRMGGIPVPSLAITQAAHPLENFGEITLVGGSDMANPKGYAATKVFGADIYSPRYPRVTYVVDYKDRARLNEKLKPLQKLTGAREIDGDSIQSDGKKALSENSALMAQFLTEKGIKPTIVQEEPVISVKEKMRMVQAGFGKYLKNNDWQSVARDENFKALAIAYADKSSTDAYKAAGYTETEANEQVKKDNDNSGRVIMDMARRIADNVDQPKGTPSRYKTTDALRKQIESRKLVDEFNAYVDKTMASLNPDEKLFQGFTNMGNRRYTPHTLDNVIKILKKDMRGGESFNYGVGSVRSRFTPQFKSIAEIQKAKGRLMDEKAFDLVKEDVNEELGTLTESLRNYHPASDRMGFGDTVTSTMYDAAKMGLPKALTENGFEDVPQEVKEQVSEFLGKLRNMPTAYFEAKILRAVDLSEFKGAVVPKNTSKKAIEALQRRGITNIKYYDNNVTDDRAAKIQELAKDSDLMFSRKESSAGQVAPAAKTQATQSVEKLVNAIKAKWANAPDIVVAFDMSDEHIPARVRAEDLKQRSGYRLNSQLDLRKGSSIASEEQAKIAFVDAYEFSDLFSSKSTVNEIDNLLKIPISPSALSSSSKTVDSNSSPSKSGFDGMRLNVQRLRNFLDGESLGEKSYSNLNVEAQGLVLHDVFGLAKNSEILRSVIRLVPIDVMNVLTGNKFSPESLFHDESVLRDRLSIVGSVSVSGQHVADTLVRATALSGAVVIHAQNSPTRSLESNPTTGAFQGNDRHNGSDKNNISYALSRSNKEIGSPRGFYYQGKVYLLSSQLNTPNEVAETLFHEALGHYGLRGMFGDSLKPILQQIATMRRAEVDAKIKEYGLRSVSNLDRLTAAEEVLAELSQTRPDIGFVRRAVAAIRTWLRNNVPGFNNLKLTNEEIINNFILPARAFVEQGRSGHNKSSGLSEQSIPDSRLANTKLLGNAALTMSKSNQGFNGLDADTQRVVQNVMVMVAHNPKILNSIIELVPVDVVNMLARKQLTLEEIFNNPSMLKELSVGVNGNKSISKTADAASAIVRATAFVATKNQSFFEMGHLGGLPVDKFSTDNTGILGASSPHLASPGGVVLSSATDATKTIGVTADLGRRTNDGGTAIGTLDVKHVVTPSSNDVLGAGGVDASSVPPSLQTSMLSRKDDAVRTGDVFKAPNGEAVTVMRALPGGKVEVRIQGNRTRLGDFTNNELKAWEKIGRADYADGAYTTPQSLIDLAKGTAGGNAAFNRGTNEAMNNAQVGQAFTRITKALDRNDLGDILFNWNESELNEDGDRIIGYPGRDGMYSKGVLGGKITIKKGDFINWLLSDAPFDEKVYPGIKADKGWADKIAAAREAIDGNQGGRSAEIQVEGFRSFEAVPRKDGSIGFHATAKVDGSVYFANLTASRREDGTWKVRSDGFETMTGKSVRGAANVKLENLMDGAREAALSWANEPTDPESGGAFSRQDQTDTPAFKAWFGDSKVVNAQGRPLVVYHGTKGDFNEFAYGDEIHLTSDPKTASLYSTIYKGKDGAPNVMPVYVSLQNPKRQNGIPTSDEIKTAKQQGHDGFILGNDGHYVVFNPEQVKSAIGNNGNWDGSKSEVNFSRSLGNTLNAAANERKKTIIGETGRQYTPGQLKAMGHVGFQVEQPSLKDRAQALWKDAGKKLAQGIVDQFAPVRELSKEAYTLLRLSKGASGAFEVFLNGGKLKLTDGVYDFDDQSKGGVVQTLLQPLGGEHHDFFRWIAANRAERLQGEGKENLFSPQDIADLKTLADGNANFDYTIQNGIRKGRVVRDRATIYRDSLVTFNQFNKNILDMSEQSGLIDGESRQVWEHEFYVPFYRVADDADGGVRGMNVKGGVVRQQAFKLLKGGKNALNADLLDNTLMNWAHLLDAAAKNRAAKATIEAAEAMGKAAGADQATLKQMASSVNNKNGVVWFMDGGQKRYSLLDKEDGPYLMTALTALEYAGMRSPVMNAMGSFKRALTIGVTASPFFKVRNLIRDSVQAIASGPLSYNPGKNIVQGWKLTDPKSDAYFRLMAGGGTIHFGTMMEGSEAKRVQALVESGVNVSTILNDEHKVKAFYRKFIEPGITAYNELGNRGEAINRASLYDQLTKQGMSHADASLQARDLMDFSMSGSFTTIRFLTQVVPFFNARIQGLYKLGRAAKEDPARFSAVLGATALFSLALLAGYSDDDDWKKREDWDRNNFWWFKFGGTAFRIPKPFEIGAMATLAERGFELAFDKEMTNKRFMTQVKNLVGDNLSMNPIPQLVKPILDVYANTDSFSGRPIETMGMDRLQPEYRFTDRTSMTARGLSTAANAVTSLAGANGPSPVQIDHMLQGYFGWLGSFVVGAGDVLARPATDQPSHAAPDYWKSATGSMISDTRDAPSRYVSQMYTQAKEIEQAYGTWKMLQKEGKVQEAADFAQDHRSDLSKYHLIEAMKRNEASANQRIRMIERSDLDGDTKRLKIRQIQMQKDRVARPASL